MVKLKQLLLEAKAPSIFIPRRTEDRVDRYIKQYIRNGSKGNLDLSGMNLTKLPDILKNINVDGDFYCYDNKLTSLNNAPNSIRGDFACSDNKLTSLIGAPSNVSRHFFCSDNKLTSLIGAPKSVGGSFDCTTNKLTTLKGSPSSVGGNFGCSNNNLTSLEGAPKFVGGDFFCSYNTVQFTNAQVRAVCDVKRYIHV